MIKHHYAISPSFHSCCRVFCDIEWSLSQKGIYVSLHGWIIAKCVQKKLWTCDWGDGFTGWIYCNDSMNADVFNFDFHFSNFQDWLLRQGGFCPLPPTPWTPPLGIYCPISVSILQSWYTVYTHNSSKGWLLGCTNSYHLSYQPNAHKTQ